MSEDLWTLEHKTCWSYNTQYNIINSKPNTSQDEYINNRQWWVINKYFICPVKRCRNLNNIVNTYNEWRVHMFTEKSVIFFSEFWEEHFQCRYPKSMRTPYNLNYSSECNSTNHLRSKKPKFENQLQFVSDSVLAFANALYDMHHEYCGENFVGLCDAMKPVKGPELLKYLRKVNFTGKSDLD